MEFDYMFKNLFNDLENRALSVGKDCPDDYARYIIQKMCDNIATREYYLIFWVMEKNSIDSDSYSYLEENFLNWAKTCGYEVCENFA